MFGDSHNHRLKRSCATNASQNGALSYDKYDGVQPRKAWCSIREAMVSHQNNTRGGVSRCFFFVTAVIHRLKRSCARNASSKDGALRQKRQGQPRRLRATPATRKTKNVAVTEGFVERRVLFWSPRSHLGCGVKVHEGTATDPAPASSATPCPPASAFAYVAGRESTRQWQKQNINHDRAYARAQKAKRELTSTAKTKAEQREGVR